MRYAFVGVLVLWLIMVANLRLQPKIERPEIPGAYYLENCRECSREGFWEAVILARTQDPSLVRIARCESALNPVARGDKKKGEGFKAYGLFQFWESTFLGFSEHYSIENPDWHNPFQQIDLAKKMFDDGYGRLWTCK